MKASAGARANLGWLKRALVHSNAPLVPLVEVESESWNLQTVLRGANERLIPILMTAAVTALGLAPLGVIIAPARTGNRRAYGRHRSRRTGVLDPAEFDRAAGSRGSVHQITEPKGGRLAPSRAWLTRVWRCCGAD